MGGSVPLQSREEGRRGSGPLHPLQVEGAYAAYVVSVEDAKWIFSTGLNVLLLILGIIELRDRARVRVAAQREAQSDYVRSRTGGAFDPYNEFGRGKHTDYNGNTPQGVRGFFFAISAGAYALVAGLVSFGTLYLVDALSVSQSTYAFQDAVGDLAVLASLVGLAGLGILWYGLHQMTAPGRRYILSYIGIWMGMKIPKEQRPINPPEEEPSPAKAKEAKATNDLVKLQRKALRRAGKK